MFAHKSLQYLEVFRYVNRIIPMTCISRDCDVSKYVCRCSDFVISYSAKDNKGHELYLALLSDWDLDAAFFGSSEPCLRLKVDLKPFEEGSSFNSLSMFTCCCVTSRVVVTSRVSVRSRRLGLGGKRR